MKDILLEKTVHESVHRKGWLSGKKYLFFLALYVGDMAAFGLSAAMTLWLFSIAIDDFYLRLLLLTFLAVLINYSAYGLYDDRRSAALDSDLTRIMSSLFLALILIYCLIFFFDAEILLFSFVLALLGILFILGAAIRSVIYFAIAAFRQAGYDRRRVVFFGAHNEDFVRKIEENRSLGYDVMASTTELGELRGLLQSADIVFLNQEHIDEEMLDLMMRYDRVTWKIISPVLNLVIDPVAFDEFKDYPLINVSGADLDRGYLRMKRLLDLVLSSVAIVILAPLFLVVAIGIKITSKGPVFFRHERLGQDMQAFQLCKFRTMVSDAETQKAALREQNEVDGLFKMKQDPRITGFGRLLRRTCIDELPQLFNIFLGHMSIVGPRPHLKEELCHFRGWRQARFKVKPGLTGMWQVNGRHELNFDKAVLYDIYYLKHISLRLDLAIILKTIPSIIASRGRH